MQQHIANPIALPFSVATEGEPDLWAVEPTGVWGEDNATGRRFADAALNHMMRTNSPTLLGSIVKAMIAKGRYGGVEVGFMSQIARHAMASREVSGQ